MKRLAFLVSGGGGNFRFFVRMLNSLDNGDLNIAAVVTEKPSTVLDFARASSIPAFEISYSRSESGQLRSILAETNPDLVICNFDRILDQQTVGSFHNRIINLHYSLLPAFPRLTGRAPVELALKRGCRFVGTTAHLVTADVDEGPIVCQSAVALSENPTLETVMDVVFRAGCLTLFNAVARVLGCVSQFEHKHLHISGLGVMFSPGLQFRVDFLDESFWKEIARS